MLSCPWTVYLESLCRPNTPPCYAVKVCRMCGVFQKTLFPSFYVLYFIIHLFAETYKKRMWYTILITTAFHRFCSHFNMVLISSLPSKQIHIRVLSGLRSHHSRGITHAVQSLGGGLFLSFTNDKKSTERAKRKDSDIGRRRGASSISIFLHHCELCSESKRISSVKVTVNYR